MLHPIHADPHLLVLNKPSGLLCVPGRGPDKQDCLSSRAQAQWPDALVVHRLDQATSGLVVMARNPMVQRQLGDAFAARQVEKRYLAVVWGEPQATEVPEAPGMPQDGQRWNLIDLPIAADWERRPLRVIATDPQAGQASQTWWRPVAKAEAEAAAMPAIGPGCSRLWLAPITGRTHQLRVHLQALSCPMLGDALYALEPVQAMAPRLLLQAQRLALAHPVSGEWLEFALPAEF
ncbi:bifunctional tRNA pseudouridine(32) synthase/23S rRNA pseudouridine(746) synthase RluA [Comamonas humi]